jgi:hypothetical protein
MRVVRCYAPDLAPVHQVRNLRLSLVQLLGVRSDPTSVRWPLARMGA